MVGDSFGRPTRRYDTHNLPRSLMEQQANEAKRSARGDIIVTSTLSLGRDGKPEGSRLERRILASQLRKKGKDKCP